MNWIFKDSNFQLDSKSEKNVVTLFQKSNFKGVPGEAVLFLEKRNSEWQFTSHFKIVSVVVKNPDSDFKEIDITLVLVKIFEEEKLLEDYIYSLRRVTNFSNPIKHFARKYSRLYDAEFDAIVEDKIYIKRTILGTVLNAMPREHQMSFMQLTAIEAPELLTGKINMDIALTILNSYLEAAVVKPAIYLSESLDMLRLFVSEDELSQIGFASDVEKLSSKNIQMIEPQVSIINKHLNSLLGFNFNNQKIGFQVLQLQENPKFKNLFRNSPLPITLK